MADFMRKDPGQLHADSSRFFQAKDVFIDESDLRADAHKWETTLHKAREREIKQVLGIPDDVTTIALIPLGYPLGKWGRPKRRAQREALTSQIAHQIQSTRSVESALQVAIRELGRVVNASRTRVRINLSNNENN